MTQHKHTPGPWSVKNNMISNGVYVVLRYLPPPEDSQYKNIYDANLRLIAAAPEMLTEALRQYSNLFKSFHRVRQCLKHGIKKAKGE